jgi:hypothetical protein
LHYISSLLVILTLCSCSSVEKVKPAKGESLYARVIHTGKIRCAYALYSPSVGPDPNAGRLGIGVDVLQLIAKKMGLQIELNEESRWGNFINDMRADRFYMLITPVWSNLRRAD